MLTAAITTLVAAMAAFAGLATAAPTAGNTLSTSGKFTYYSTGLGACGYTNTDADYVVALSRKSSSCQCLPILGLDKLPVAPETSPLFPRCSQLLNREVNN